MNRVKVEKPFVLVGCPPCTAMSQLFESNKTRMDPEQRNRAIQEAIVHLKFCTELYRIQIRGEDSFCMNTLGEHGHGSMLASQGLSHCENWQMKHHGTRMKLHIPYGKRGGDNCIVSGNLEQE